jgi:hypothetical protein
MHLLNFTLDGSVEIGVAGQPRPFGLHNCFDWQSVAYVSDERRIRLLWKRSTGDWVKPDLPLSLALEFPGVSNFAACPRKPGLPFTEDSCLAHVTFTPSELASNFKGLFLGYRDDPEHLTFLFMSGFGLKIWSEEAELFIDPKA